MPTVLPIGLYRFHFYSDEYCEPPHIHVETADGECKFWLNPVQLADNRNLTPKTVREFSVATTWLRFLTEVAEN